MRLLKRFLALVLVLLSLVGFLLCLAGVAGIWMVQRAVFDRTTQTFTYADHALDVATNSLDLVYATLEKSRADLRTIEETSGRAARNGKPPGFFDRMVAQTLAQQLGPKVREVNNTVNMATDASVILNTFLGGINQLPQATVSVLDTDRLKQIQDSLSEFSQTSQRLSSLMQQASPEENADLAVTTSRMEELLERVLTWTAELQARIGKVQAEVAVVKPRIFLWIQIGPLVITALLVWLAASQLCMLAYGWTWMRR